MRCAATFAARATTDAGRGARGLLVAHRRQHLFDPLPIECCGLGDAQLAGIRTIVDLDGAERNNVVADLAGSCACGL